MSDFTDVRDFQLKFNQIVSFYPRHLTERKVTERANFMLEELTEFVEGAGLRFRTLIPVNGEDNRCEIYIAPTGNQQDMAKMADALIDLVYVAMGTAVMMGLPWKDLWDDVHRANMAKVPGTTHRGNKVDVMKPPGWVPPHTEEILATFGYKAEVDNQELRYLDDSVYTSSSTTVDVNGEIEG